MGGWGVGMGGRTRSMVRPSTDLQIVGERLILMECGEVFVPESFSSSKKKMQRAGLVWTRRGSLNPEVAPSLGGFCPIPFEPCSRTFPGEHQSFRPRPDPTSSSALQSSSFDKSVLQRSSSPKFPRSFISSSGSFQVHHEGGSPTLCPVPRHQPFSSIDIFSQKTRPRKPPHSTPST